MTDAVCQSITGGGDAVGTVLCLSGADGAVKVCHHAGAQPTGAGERHTAAAAAAKRLSFAVAIGGANGADCLCHGKGVSCELRE